MQKFQHKMTPPKITYTLTLDTDIILTHCTIKLIKIHLTLSKNTAPGKIDTPVLKTHDSIIKIANTFEPKHK